MPDSIFNESMRQGITCSFLHLFVVCLFLFLFVLFFLRGDTSVFLKMKEMESVLSL